MEKTQQVQNQNLLSEFGYEPVSTSLTNYSATVRQPLLKRPLDVTLSGLGLVISAPVWALIALAVKLGDGGPVFYTQERVGIGGKLFKGLKFRTMIVEADRKFGPLQAREWDPRITRVGRLLRATAADELPQLWNIFKGDMSFVGPRALAAQEIEVNGNGELVPLRNIPGFQVRHSVRPGLTGIAQVYARRDISRRHKFLFDKVYVNKATLWLDLRLIAVSFWISFNGKWESRAKRKF